MVPDSLNKKFGPDTGLTFASWMAFAIPCMMVCTIIAWAWLQKLQSWYPGAGERRSKEKEERAMKVIRERHRELGRMTVHEIQVLLLFILLILLWFFKSPHFMPGMEYWSRTLRKNMAPNCQEYLAISSFFLSISVFH